MILKCPDDIEYTCDKAVKNERDFTIKAYQDDREVAAIYAVLDFSEYTVEGGEWSYPDPTPEEQLRADVDYLTMENESLSEQAESARADVDYCLMMMGEEL